MNLDSKTQAIVAIGCATAANCTGCLERTVSIAKQLGIGQEEIGEAIEVGRRVREGAANKLDQFAATVSGASAESSQGRNGGCALHRILKPSRD